MGGAWRAPPRLRSVALRAVATLSAGLGSGVAVASHVDAQVDETARLLDGAESLGWAVGEPDAPLTVVEFTDVSCPYCASFHGGTRAELVREFVATGRVRWITLSYLSGLYPHSQALAIAAECAGRQRRYEDFMGAAYEAREDWVRARESSVASVIEELAQHTGLDANAFESCRRDPEVRERLEAVQALARSVGVRGTPAWFVGGFQVMGDLPVGYARQFIVSRLEG